MADPLAQLPADDESPQVLLDAYIEYMQANVEGWQPSPGALELAIGAAGADEDSVQYALMREVADDWARDFGQIYDVADPQPVPATTTTTWTARPGRGGFLTAGTTIAIDAPQGLVGFEVIQATEFAAGQTVTGILVQALDDWTGTAANGATGGVQMDQQPGWVASILVEQPASGGSDAADDAEQLAKIKRAAKLQHVAPVHADDLELAVQDVPLVQRALVRDNFDDDTGQADMEGVCSVYPIDAAGEALTSGSAIAQIKSVVSGDGRRILNGVIKVAAATYTTYDVALVVIPDDGYDEGTLTAGAISAVGRVFDPSLHGQPRLGELRLWRMRRIIRPYEAAAQVDLVDGIDQIDDVRFTVVSGPGIVDVSGNAVLGGNAPLPRLGQVTVSFIAPA